VTTVAPFFKAAGGKRQLLSELRKHIPAKFGRYFEPFVGGGALYFDLVSSGRIRSACPWLNDANPDLLSAYLSLRDHVEPLIGFLKQLSAAYVAGDREAYFYKVRATQMTSTLSKAVRFLFLNKTCFNGLWRVNQKTGENNVPHGKYKNPTICDEVALRAASWALQGAAITNLDFEAAVLGHERAGDLVYFDPPYVPVSETADFTSYTKDGFTLRDQERLRDLALTLKKRGVHVILSNADVPMVRTMYGHGFDLHAVSARRNINSKSAKRGPVGELIIT